MKPITGIMGAIQAQRKQLAQKFNENHDEVGRFAESDGGETGGGGSSSSGQAGDAHPSSGGYVSMATGTATVRIEANGQIALTKPKTIDDSLAQLAAMNKILVLAKADHDANGGRASLRYRHAITQMSRAMGYAKLVAAKARAGKKSATLTDLERLLSVLQLRWNVVPVDPDGDNPQLLG